MNIEPLSKKIYDKAVALGITQIELKFSGGSDEGYLSVYVNGQDGWKSDTEFEGEVEGWAWSAYGYSGAGDGNDYGDDVVYDIVNKKATSSEWSMQRTEGYSEGGDLEIAEEIAEEIE
jgi:hypothetical protein